MSVTHRILYVGIGGTSVAQPVNEDNYKNAEMNATKEIREVNWE